MFQTYYIVMPRHSSLFKRHTCYLPYLRVELWLRMLYRDGQTAATLKILFELVLYASVTRPPFALIEEGSCVPGYIRDPLLC